MVLTLYMPISCIFTGCGPQANEARKHEDAQNYARSTGQYQTVQRSTRPAIVKTAHKNLAAPLVPFCVPSRTKHDFGSAQLLTAAYGIRPPDMPCPELNT